ncbi:MAG: response regulator [Micavibrio aeruginosavorus]|uniref:Response regulator n=1 Tax=Micavibrio aeruginosavorus TaxID=349221 RepID=A0A7T5UGC9_9BACT|nr:MAG: response regulator [Micavibrio aeruginosavorus]
MTKCLIVDDSATVRRIIRGMLEGFGFSCDEAADGQIALDYCRKGMPDFIMLDWNMPVMNGIEFLRHFNQEPKSKNPAVIFCTTESDSSFIQEALSEGASEYVMKPFDKEVIGLKLVQLGILDESAFEEAGA